MQAGPDRPELRNFPESLLEMASMSTSGKTKSNQQPVLAANVAQILAELHRLAATNVRTPVADRPASCVCAPGQLSPPQWLSWAQD
jgi:hypothetical protein